MDFSGRRQRLVDSLETGGFEAALISHLPHLGYLFDFWGSAGLALWDSRGFRLIVDGRYAEQARAETSGAQVEEIIRGSLLDAALGTLEASKPDSLAIEAASLSAADYIRLESVLTGTQLTDGGGLVESLRIRKETAEIELIERAYAIVAEVMDSTLAHIRPGVSELEIAAEIVYRGLSLGADELAFETLVATGPRTALPHASPSARQWQEEEPLLIDCGFRLNHYISDYTRMVHPESVGAEIVSALAASRRAAFDSLRPGVASAEVDAAARRVLDEAGLAECFPHGTGHGIGLEVHEAPRLSTHSDDTLESGMIVTLEPGVYLPGQGGVRIEDAAVVTEDGARWIV